MRSNLVLYSCFWSDAQLLCIAFLQHPAAHARALSNLTHAASLPTNLALFEL